jgi:DnaJ-class molecular chaperone
MTKEAEEIQFRIDNLKEHPLSDEWSELKEKIWKLEDKICPKCEGYGEIEIKEYSVRQDMIRSNGRDPGEPEAGGVGTCPNCKGKGIK